MSECGLEVLWSDTCNTFMVNGMASTCLVAVTCNHHHGFPSIHGLIASFLPLSFDTQGIIQECVAHEFPDLWDNMFIYFVILLSLRRAWIEVLFFSADFNRFDEHMCFCQLDSPKLATFAYHDSKTNVKFVTSGTCDGPSMLWPPCDIGWSLRTGWPFCIKRTSDCSTIELPTGFAINDFPHHF